MSEEEGGLDWEVPPEESWASAFHPWGVLGEGACNWGSVPPEDVTCLFRCGLKGAYRILGEGC